MASTRSVSGSPCSFWINPTKRPPQIAHSDPAATQPRHTILAQRMAETHGAGPGAGARYVKTIQPVGVLSCHLLWLQCYKVTPFSPQTTQPLPQQPVAAPVPAVASRQTAGHKHKPPAPIKTRTRGSGAAQVKYFLYCQIFFVGNPEVTLILLHFRCGRARCAARWRVGTATTVARYGISENVTIMMTIKT